jgi:hypothetical protein
VLAGTPRIRGLIWTFSSFFLIMDGIALALYCMIEHLGLGVASGALLGWATAFASACMVDRLLKSPGNDCS